MTSIESDCAFSAATLIVTNIRAQMMAFFVVKRDIANANSFTALIDVIRS